MRVRDMSSRGDALRPDFLRERQDRRTALQPLGSALDFPSSRTGHAGACAARVHLPSASELVVLIFSGAPIKALASGGRVGPADTRLLGSAVKTSGLPKATSISRPGKSAPVSTKPDRSSDVSGAVACVANAIAVARVADTIACMANTIAVVSVGVVSVAVVRRSRIGGGVS